jgi:hypothetical protein
MPPDVFHAIRQPVRRRDHGAALVNAGRRPPVPPGGAAKGRPAVTPDPDWYAWTLKRKRSERDAVDREVPTVMVDTTTGE